MLKTDDHHVILEPYFDGGDSYPDHFKYSVLSRYTASGVLQVDQGWSTGNVSIPAGAQGSLRTTIVKQDLSLFDTVTLKMLCSKEVRVQVFFDGQQVMDTYGAGMNFCHEAPCALDSVTEIAYTVTNESSKTETVGLYYLGMARKCEPDIPYVTGPWEGCFADEISFLPMDEDVLSVQQLETLRVLVTREPLKASYEAAREAALRCLESDPELRIGKTVEPHFRGRNLLSGVQELALVGILEKREDMIRMAIRYALSAASCTYWCSDRMEEIPVATWHHRSFTELNTVNTVSTVLSLCGNSMTWHCRNILYQALLLKGLPRMEADFVTMDYIYKMNQGLVFLSGYVRVLVCLQHRFPRVDKKLRMAEELFQEMLSYAINQDGSVDEGAGYWSYTIGQILDSAMWFARNKGMRIREYLNGKLDKTAAFGLFLLEDNGNHNTYNDSHGGKESAWIAGNMYQLTGDPNWANLYHHHCGNSFMDIVKLGCPEIPDVPELTLSKAVEEFPCPGLVSVRREDARIFLISGPSTDGHTHFDKGSFILYHKGAPVLLDRGICDYRKAGGAYMGSSEAHNLAVPFDGKEAVNQRRGAQYEAPYTYQVENGKLYWQTDITDLWDPSLVVKNTRSIVSESPYEYLITDEFTFTKEMAVAVNFHMPAEDAVVLEICQGTIQREVTEEDTLVEQFDKVCRRTFYTKPGKHVQVQTRVTIPR